ncbi:hypothetical protein ACHAQA_002817 [Verticillium albo-atrum]
MASNPQTESPFITSLPRDVRDAIYLELWSTSGLRQHILFHSYEQNWNARHFCRWACTTKFELRSSLQRDIEQLRSDLNVPLGEDITGDQDPRAVVYGRRLQSPWLNHWACGERADREHGFDAIRSFNTSRFCWKMNRADGERAAPTPSAYIPMLLSCKVISAECLQSIYESTTFVFTDMKTIQMFFGYCAMHPIMQAWPKHGITPPAFYKHARRFELSLFPTFPLDLQCAQMDLPGLEKRHEVYDFHWLQLNRFENLQNVYIWIEARSLYPLGDDQLDFTGIKKFTSEELCKAFSPFEHLDSATISTPLGISAGQEHEAFVDGVVAGRISLFKRGTGDLFHPYLNAIHPGHSLDGWIHTSIRKEVRLALDGGGVKYD